MIDVRLVERRAHALFMLSRLYSRRATRFTLIAPIVCIGVLLFNYFFLFSSEWS